MSAKASAILDKAEKAARDLIECLNAPPINSDERNGSTTGEDGGFISFFDTKLGGLHISGREGALYRECIETLTHVHGRNQDERTMSRDAVERLLRRTILRTLRPKKAIESDTRAKFAGRLSRELRVMRTTLGALPLEWHIVVQVQGLGPHGLPFKFGGVEFEAGSQEVGQRVATRIIEFKPKRRTKQATVAAENATRVRDRNELTNALSERSVAFVKVLAVDDKAAKHLGVQRLQRSLDALNFFAPFLQERRTRAYRTYLAPEGARTHLVWAAYPNVGETFHWSERWPGSNPTVFGFDRESDGAKEIGLTRASAIFAADVRSDLEERIVNSLAWAGRARVEPRRDQAFLLNVIALEALLTKPKSRSGVTDRIRLRAAHLIGGLPKTKQRVFELMGRLYDVRSSIVHNGDSGDLTDRDLETISELVNRSLTDVLTDQRFTNMRTAKDFDHWFEKQILA
jgi:hypothetical protein